LFPFNNEQVYYGLEEALHGTQYQAALTPFQQQKDGRAAYLVIKSQFAGEDKWELERVKQEDILHNHVFKGQLKHAGEVCWTASASIHAATSMCSAHSVSAAE
jgi:hypothetical protein